MTTKKIVSGYTITIEEQYDDFPSFFDASRKVIYETILKAFNDLKQTKVISVNIHATVDGFPFTSELEYGIEDVGILKDVINPYFEETEEYEVCKEVMKLYSELRSN